ncbi:MAG TPA: amidohydrolase family protein [Gemmatimonadales bacterium]|jgi:imidazolonepropionase-like amidohydrolase|nr:amidohydrolase family protein [Gemmatimonadales bacterium]
MRSPAFIAFALLLSNTLSAQRPDSLSEEVSKYIAVDTAVIALTHVQLLDGTGAPAKSDQSILIRNGRIAEVGPAASVKVPAGVRTMDLSGHTVIPGLVGMHNHLFYTAAGGRAAQMSYTGPRLYLAAGVTTIRTAGGRSPYAEINLRDNINRGRVPGPRIHLTAPYITGEPGGGSMDVVTSPAEARRFVAYWASEGATWIKAYTDIRRAELKAAIQEAHRRGLKVTGHLCSVSFREAVALGIDNLEHGMLTASDFDRSKQPDVCPVTVGQSLPEREAAREVIQAMVKQGVSMTSTLAVYEPFVARRPTRDPRVLNAMAPEVRQSYLKIRNEIDSAGTGSISGESFAGAMAFEKSFSEAGGLLASGVDPTGIGGALAGYGDQRNYELFVEAGFTPPQAIRIMTLNGARILGVQQRLGSVERGKLADLVVLDGDLNREPAVIRRPTLVFKDGIGYDSAKLLESIQGRVGID